MLDLNSIRLGIIGFGLIGKQRYRSAINIGILAENIFVFDLAGKFIENSEFENLNLVSSESEMMKKQISHCIISTPHDVATLYAKRLLDSQIKVLLEKPMGRSQKESEDLISHIHSSKLSLGFNYRFMPGIQILKQNLLEKTFGNVISLKIDLGHGGSPTDFTSWKLSPEKSGGGALLDPGIHVIDLIQFLLDIKLSDFEISGVNSWQGFWNTGIEECVFAIGKVDNVLVNLTISIVSWKTKFKLELIGTEGYFEIDGRGRSDGPQMISEGKRWAWLSGPSQLDSEVRQILTNEDNSLQDELFDWISEGPFHAHAEQGYQSMVFYSRLLSVMQRNDHS
jgi:predicted dehydrogenase